MSNATKRFLTEFEIEQTGIAAVGTLRRWRLQRQGPPFIKSGRSVKYPVPEFEQWLAARPRGGAEARP
jgi:hypothetical protein